MFFARKTKTAAAFDSRLNGEVLKFSVADDDGFRDSGTGSLWNIEGRCVSGKLAGQRLKRLVFTQSRWYGWSALFRNTTIYGADTKPCR